ILLAQSTTDPSRVHAYLADFGLTRRASSVSRVTSTGIVLGTLGYIAPEQLRGDVVDRRTDEYSLTCVAYEALTGVGPFKREGEVAVIAAHLHDAPPRASDVRRDLPFGVDGVLQRGMAKDPNDRYPTAGDLGIALQRSIVGESTQLIAGAHDVSPAAS